MEYYSAIKEDKILPFAAAWMDMENIMLNEIRWSERQVPYIFHSYAESNKQTELRSKIETDS